MGKKRTIGFDADDTLWENETLFYDAQKRFNEVLRYHSENSDRELLNV